jgi:5'-deoxynucleotidase YfbR-like HD superfamily hydrolase
LDYVWRYSTIPISVPENVSTHSYWVATYSAMIHQSLNPDDHITLSACVLQALIHDMPESQIGDFVRTFKYRSESLKKSIDEAEEEIIKEFGKPIQILYEVTNKLVEISGKKQYVKDVVKAADFLSLHNFMVREITRGNHEILPFYKRMVDDLEKMTYNKTSHEASESLSMFYLALKNNAERILNSSFKKSDDPVSLRKFK